MDTDAANIMSLFSRSKLDECQSCSHHSLVPRIASEITVTVEGVLTGDSKAKLGLEVTDHFRLAPTAHTSQQ